jgi:hypothetical protein
LEWKKKRWGILQTVVSDSFKNFFKRKTETDCRAEELQKQQQQQLSVTGSSSSLQLQDQALKD